MLMQVAENQLEVVYPSGILVLMSAMLLVQPSTAVINLLVLPTYQPQADEKLGSVVVEIARARAISGRLRHGHRATFVWTVT